MAAFPSWSGSASPSSCRCSPTCGRTWCSAMTGRTFPGQTTTWSAAFVDSRRATAASVAARSGMPICCATGARRPTTSGGSRMRPGDNNSSRSPPGSIILAGANCVARPPSPSTSNSRAFASVTSARLCSLPSRSAGLPLLPRILCPDGKKTLAASERREEDRASFRKQVKPLDAKRLVFVDESGSNIALTPLYARAPRGQRAHGSVPRNRGKNTTLLASLSVQGIGASMILEGATNAAAFEIYLEQILLPSLAPGQIVVMDNLSAHKGARVRQLIEERGCQLLFLPAYSPDFSPIEETFSKIKAYLRRVGARTREALEEAIAQALETVTPQDAHGWFGHCGYSPLHESNA